TRTQIGLRWHKSLAALGKVFFTFFVTPDFYVHVCARKGERSAVKACIESRRIAIRRVRSYLKPTETDVPKGRRLWIAGRLGRRETGKSCLAKARHDFPEAHKDLVLSTID
ncbi:MAG: hypothetical protein KAV00_13105, partial [Phycisphaerae bacterium]|nr:hypothetical protein [Phycisphaerae bacterium]